MPCLFFLALAAVVILALIPTRFPALGTDAAQHVAALSMLTLLARCAVRGRAIAVTAAMLAFAGMIELVQLLPSLTRQADWVDAAWSAVGVGLGTSAYWLAARVVSLSGASAVGAARADRIQRSVP